MVTIKIGVRGIKNTHTRAQSQKQQHIHTQTKKRAQEQNDRVTTQKHAQISLKHFEGVVTESRCCSVLLECLVYW
jgi:hypothetical protein